MTFTSRDSAVGSVVINLHDVTVERALEERLRFDAMHDPLTGTWNRAAFAEAMEMACAAGARDGGTIALLFVDIDGFKQINDTLGHDRGDELLRHVARSIQSCLRGGDVLGRWGGDEFVVLLTHVGDGNEPAVVADRILAELERATVGPGAMSTTASIGIATSTDGALSAADLARVADEAMYSAKRDGRARWALIPSPPVSPGQTPHDRAAQAI
jgi:diguanylate cyclase (GGDEF)-like protein